MYDLNENIFPRILKWIVSMWNEWRKMVVRTEFVGNQIYNFVLSLTFGKNWKKLKPKYLSYLLMRREHSRKVSHLKLKLGKKKKKKSWKRFLICEIWILQRIWSCSYFAKEKKNKNLNIKVIIGLTFIFIFSFSHFKGL